MISAYQVDPESLAELLPGEPRYRVDQLREWLYRHPVLNPEEMTNLPTGVRSNLTLWRTMDGPASGYSEPPMAPRSRRY